MRQKITISLILISKLLYAQDYHFSQFYTSAMLFNPAVIANQESDYKTLLQRRSQWQSVSVPFTTTSLTFEAKEILYNQSLGIQFIYDRAGDSKLSTTGFSLGASRKIFLTKESDLKLGLEAGVYQKKIDFSSLIFPQPNIPVEIKNETFSFLDISLGGQFEWRIDNNNKIQLGNSIFHINNPNQSYNENNAPLPIKTNIYIHTIHRINKKTTIFPRVFHSIQDKSQESLFGSGCNYIFKKSNGTELILKTGIYSRWNDAIICSFGLKKNNFTAVFSYDINTSSLAVASDHKGGGEITLIYEWDNKKKQNNKACPTYL